MTLRALVIALVVLSMPLPPASAAPRTHQVVIDKMKFGAVPADLRVGDRILWVNKDIFRHTATAKDRSFDVDLQAGASGTSVVRKTGAISVICRYHPGMRAMLKVKP
jgi:plastocyanin